MYTVSEDKLNTLLGDATRILDKLSHTNVLPKTEITHFGNALVDVQTEVHNQSKYQDVGLGRQRLEV
jgi:hypothetical protein